ncbi:hypothetical protein HY251_20880 [bacterium]|nr:hypothetical protein [bacterium]
MTPSRRIRVLLVAAWLALGCLATRLYSLQVVRGDELRAKAERRRRKVELLPPRRGRILDAKGRVLALDRPAQDVTVELPELDPSLELVRVLAWATRSTTDEVARSFRGARARVRAGARTAIVAHAKDSAARDRVLRLSSRFPGISIAPAVSSGCSVAAPDSLLGARDRTLDRLSVILDREPALVRALVQAREDEIRAIPDRYERLRAWNEPIVVARDVSFDLAARVEEASFETPGVSLARTYGRSYPWGPLAAHVLGYLGKLSDAEQEKLKRDGLLLDESADELLLSGTCEIAEGCRLRRQLVGRSGLEARLDSRLAGVPGARVVERDAALRSRETLVCVAPRDGDDVRLTIDAELQAAAEAALDLALAKHGTERAGGAAVLVSIETGDVLALASAPRFDANEVARVYGSLLADPASPLVDRAVEPAPPGSTLKVLSAFAFFGGDGLSPRTTFTCEGALFPGKKGFHCDAVHGSQVGLERALSHSCNVFFFRASDATEDAWRLSSWAERAGLGRLASHEIPQERKGSFPDPSWKQRRLEEAARTAEARREKLLSFPASGSVLEREILRSRVRRADDRRSRCAQDLAFGPGDRRNAAIGQGDVLTTPLQIARLAALVANGGRSPRARFLATDEEAEEIVSLDPDVLALVRAGLAGCVERGTASSSHVGLHGLDVAGKTGTAERRAGEPNYAWFMGYYPASRPEVAFAALVDRTHGHGGDVCGPIARALVTAYARSRGEEPKRR